MRERVKYLVAISSNLANSKTIKDDRIMKPDVGNVRGKPAKDYTCGGGKKRVREFSVGEIDMGERVEGPEREIKRGKMCFQVGSEVSPAFSPKKDMISKSVRSTFMGVRQSVVSDGRASSDPVLNYSMCQGVPDCNGEIK